MHLCWCKSRISYIYVERLCWDPVSPARRFSWSWFSSSSPSFAQRSEGRRLTWCHRYPSPWWSWQLLVRREQLRFGWQRETMWLGGWWGRKYRRRKKPRGSYIFPKTDPLRLLRWLGSLSPTQLVFVAVTLNCALLTIAPELPIILESRGKRRASPYDSW